MSENENGEETPWHESRTTRAREVPQRRTRDLHQGTWQASAPRRSEWISELWCGLSIVLCAIVLFVFARFAVMPSWLAGIIQGIGLGVLMVGILVVGDALGKRSRQ